MKECSTLTLCDSYFQSGYYLPSLRFHHVLLGWCLSTIPSLIRCGTEKMCTIIGPSVIDIKGVPSAVRDFCAYTLLKVTGLEIDGYFRSRLLTDVPFLHKVTLTTTQELRLKPGGVVTVSIWSPILSQADWISTVQNWGTFFPQTHCQIKKMDQEKEWWCHCLISTVNTK